MGRSNKKGRRIHGILLLDKATGCSSNHALQRVKRLFDAQKAGHTGSLDPLATGMLPICFGEATKVSAFLLNADKSYETDARLGIRTNSGDADGEVIETLPLPAGLDEITVAQTLQRFIGRQDQTPPMYSAIKVDGQRLYKLARKGITVERQARSVTIHSIDLLGWQGDLLTLRVHCSKGTYIRTLVEDIGTALGCGAHVERLRRVSVSPFGEHAMVTQQTIEQQLSSSGLDDLDKFLLPTDSALEPMPRCDIDADSAAAFCQGQSVPNGQLTWAQESLIDPNADIRVYSKHQLLGIGKISYTEESEYWLKPFRVLNW